ncbi:hypothetical protein [Lysobacter sp. ESA13C]|uniref:hypothetical protein n=1 Tax=Lysobacter sp. ESA13C TaxID=2862676 RepID=UPI001CBAC606|nr:hypothetical protein [Lysobacter sp. ESA13C]
MDAKSFRNALERFLGEERFTKFVRRGAVPRLLYWQEREWERFIEAHPEFAPAFTQLDVLLRFCVLHGEDLLHDHIEVFHGTARYDDAYIAERQRLFPYANAAPYITQGLPYTGDTIAVWYCPRCRQLASRFKFVRETE